MKYFYLKGKLFISSNNSFEKSNLFTGTTNDVILEVKQEYMNTFYSWNNSTIVEWNQTGHTFDAILQFNDTDREDEQYCIAFSYRNNFVNYALYQFNESDYYNGYCYYSDSFNTSALSSNCKAKVDKFSPSVFIRYAYSQSANAPYCLMINKLYLSNTINEACAKPNGLLNGIPIELYVSDPNSQFAPQEAYRGYNAIIPSIYRPFYIKGLICKNYINKKIYSHFAVHNGVGVKKENGLGGYKYDVGTLELTVQDVKHEPKNFTRNKPLILCKNINDTIITKYQAVSYRDFNEAKTVKIVFNETIPEHINTLGFKKISANINLEFDFYDFENANCSVKSGKKLKRKRYDVTEIIFSKSSFTGNSDSIAKYYLVNETFYQKYCDKENVNMNMKTDTYEVWPDSFFARTNGKDNNRAFYSMYSAGFLKNVGEQENEDNDITYRELWYTDTDIRGGICGEVVAINIDVDTILSLQDDERLCYEIILNYTTPKEYEQLKKVKWYVVCLSDPYTASIVNKSVFVPQKNFITLMTCYKIS